MPGHYNVSPKEEAGDNFFYGCTTTRPRLVQDSEMRRVRLPFSSSLHETDLFCSSSFIQGSSIANFVQSQQRCSTSAPIKTSAD